MEISTVALDRPLRVGLVDDHLLFRKGLASLLKQTPEIELVLEADDGQQFIDQMEGPTELDVVLLDLEMPHLDGVATTRWLRLNRPEVHIIILSMHGDDSLIINLLEEGVSGYLLKNADPDEVIQAIFQVWLQGHYFNTRITEVMQRQLRQRQEVRRLHLTTDGKLNESDREILLLVIRGMTSQEIADKLCISHRTVEGRRLRMQQKLGLHSKADLIRFAAENKLLGS